MANRLSSEIHPLIDIGANLAHRRILKSLSTVLQRANAQAGVKAIVVTSRDVESSKEGLSLVREFPSPDIELFATVGMHPHHARLYDKRKTISDMRKLIEDNRKHVVAIGDCGLDHDRFYSNRDIQREAFTAQLHLACELSLPLLTHERDGRGHSSFLNIVDPFLKRDDFPPMIVHSFSGGRRQLQSYLERGFYIGFGGSICREKAGRHIREIAHLVPLDKLLIGSDAPFMFPEDKSKAKCEPKHLQLVINTIAHCYNIGIPTIARHVVENATKVLQLDKASAHQQSDLMEEKSSS